MKPIFFLIFFLFPFASFAQQIEPGTWVKSTLINNYGEMLPAPKDSSAQFIKYTFAADGKVEISSDVLFKQMDATYSITDTVLTIGFVKYKIEKLTKDSLLIHQINKNDLNPSYCYLRCDGTRSSDKPEFNAVLQDSVYRANRYFFPEGLSHQAELTDDIGFYDGKGEMLVTFIINKLGKVVEVKIDGEGKTDKNYIASLTRSLQWKKLKWAPARINGKNVNTLVKFKYLYNGFGYDGKNPGRKMTWTSIAYVFSNETK